MPADYALLCAFIGKFKGLHSGNTICSWLAGISSITHHGMVTMTGYTLPTPLPTKKALNINLHRGLLFLSNTSPVSAALSISHLLSTLRFGLLPLPLSLAAAVLVRLLLLLVPPSIPSTMTYALPRMFHLLQCTLVAAFSYHLLFRILFQVLRDGTRSASFDIPRTKTTKELSATVILTARCDGDPLCPVAALKNHLDVNSSTPTSSTLFAYKTSLGELKNLLKNEFLSFVTAIWSSAMLAHLLGHSFCIGSTVELLLTGVPPEIVAATGRWTSLAFLIYWRRMDEILPMSTSKAYNQAHLHRLAVIFEEFRIAQKLPSDVLDKFTSS